MIALCRTPSPELASLGVQIVDGIDMTDVSAAARVLAALGSLTIDVLIHNAGIYASSGLSELDGARMTEEYAINAIAPVLWTAALSARLAAGSKVVLITSRAGSIAGNVEGGGYGYRMSKAALNMAGVSLARDLAARQTAVLILSPGTVLTDMVRDAFERASVAPSGVPSADEVAPLLCARIDALDMASTGSFVGRNGEAIPW